MERFWRNIFGALASARFHRPDSGLGLNQKAQANIKSARMLTDEMNVFACEPNNKLLSDRSENEAYCIANPGKEYAVYFTDGGEIGLDVSALEAPASLRWLDVMKSQWQKEQKVQARGKLILKCPAKGYWAVLVQTD